MYEDTLISDSVIHAYNNRPENARKDTARKVLDNIQGLSNGASAPKTEHSEER